MKNKNINAEDIRNLSRDDIEGIKTRGDDYLRDLVRQYELELDNELEL